MRRISMEKKTNKTIKKPIDKNKQKITKLKDENYKLRAICFYLLKIHRVAPAGVKQGKTEKEINQMTLQTLEHVIKQECSEKIFEDYKHATMSNLLKIMKKG